MPDAIIEAPAAPAPAAAPATAPADAPAAARPEIRVSEMLRNDAPAKPGSARDKMNQKLREKAGVKPAAEPPKAAEAPSAEPPKAAEGAEPPAPAEGEKSPTGDKKEKVNPWKLVEEYKAKIAKAEAEQLEISKRAIDKTEWTKTQERLAAQEKRNQELEEEIKYTNYSKSKEFADKYQAPYEAAWKRAMGDLSTVKIDDAGTLRNVSGKDILELVNLDLQSAQEVAEAKFGNLADRVMSHRDKIRELFDEQNSALEQARKGGTEREQQRQQQFQAQQKEMQKTITEGWTKANEKAVADPAVSRFLKPVEGDVEWNGRLEKATKLADQAFSENPMMPNLSPEQRNEIIERHAAVRNRAIAYSMLKYENGRLDTKLKTLEAKLKEYESGEPPAAGSVAAPTGELKGMDRIRAGLAKIARPS